MTTVIIGASRGVGRALAIEYARQNHKVIILARDEANLEITAQKCKEVGTLNCDYFVCDVNNTDELTKTLGNIYSSYTIDKWIYAAGITSLASADNLEDIKHSENLISTNLNAAVVLTNFLIPLMLKDNHGHISYFSSLGSYYGMAYSPVYCASKAGLRVYAESVRQYCSKTNVKISVITMGFVESDMSVQFKRPKPFIISSKHAAEYIYKRIQKEKAYIRFPFLLQFGIRIQSILPYKIADFFMIKSGYGRY